MAKPFGLQHTIEVPSNPLPEGADYSPAAQVTMRAGVALLQDPDTLGRLGVTWGESQLAKDEDSAW